MTSTAIWSRDAALPTWAPLEESRREDVVIVGAGLAGLGLSRALRDRGIDPLVIDARGPAAGASGRNAGFVLRTHVTEYPSLRARVGVELARELLAVAKDNHARIADIAPRGAHRRCGSLMLASGPEEIAMLTEAQLLLGADGVRTTEVKVPGGLSGFDVALRIDDDGEVHPGKLVAALAKGARGAVARASSIEEGLVRCGDVAIEARSIVLATNAWTGSLAPRLARVITPHRAQMLATAPVAPTLDVPCYAGLGFDYFRQRDDGRVLLGGQRHLFVAAEETDAEDTSDEVQRALDGYRHAHLAFARGAAIEARWSGIMAFSADGLPLAGRIPGARDQWALAGWTGHGLGLSLAVADRLAARMTGGGADPVLDALDPARFFPD